MASNIKNKDYAFDEINLKISGLNQNHEKKTYKTSELFNLILTPPKNSTPTIVPMILGASSITLDYTNVNNYQVTRLVIKILKNQTETLHEAVGNAYVKRFGLQSPDCVIHLEENVHQVKQDSNNSSSSSSSSNNTSCSNPSRGSTEASSVKSFPEISSLKSLCKRLILIMEHTNGVTLTEAFSREDILSKIKDWKSIHKQFGMIAILDLFMGNFDRLFGMRGLNFDRHINFGNIMIDHHKLSLVNNHKLLFIDNPTCPAVIKLKEPFDREREIQKVENLKMAPYLKKRKIESLKKISCYQLVNNVSLLFEKVIKNQKKERKDFINVIAEEFETLMQQTEQVTSTCKDQYKQHLRENILSGMQEGIKRLKNQFSKDFLPESLEKKLSHGFLSLMEKNKKIISTFVEKK